MASIQPTHQLRNWLLKRWPSLLPIVIGIIIALAAYILVYDHVVPPFSDEDIELMEPWRLAVLNFVYYLPLCLGQWGPLRRSVPSAFLWVVATMGAVCVVQPLTVGILWALGYDMLALMGWLFGVGSGIWAALSQWLVLRRWTRNSGRWFGSIPLIWMGMLPVIHVPTVVIPLDYLEYFGLVLWALYQYLVSCMLLHVLDTGRHVEHVDKSLGA